MASAIVRINGVRVYRDKIVKYWKDGPSVHVLPMVGPEIVKSWDDDDADQKATQALAVLDNLTDFDDIDGF